MLLGLVFAYVWGVALTASSTILLIICGSGWGQLPHLYLKAVRRIQQFYPDLRARQASDIFYPGIIEKVKRSALVRLEDSSARFHFLSDSPDFWTLTSDAARSGIEAIIQDELAPTFDRAPVYGESLLPLRVRPEWNLAQTSLFYVLAAFRIGFLLPVRVIILVGSFTYIALSILFGFLYPYTEVQKVKIAIIYTRLFSASMGLVANFKNPHLRPKRPGVAMSNHLSPNDIQFLWSDIQPGSWYGYAVTGQKHTGIIWAIERLCERAGTCMWLDRSNPDERRDFTGKVLDHARIAGPVLLFPEGYCTNNTSTLRYRKALFEDNLDIYPIAIRQNAEFGDSFWQEDLFHTYLLRVLTSWAVVYNVTYLPVMRREPDETASTFALRVQKVIADAAGIRAVPFDGMFWYKKDERARYKRFQQEECAKTVGAFDLERSETDSGASSDFDVLDESLRTNPITAFNYNRQTTVQTFA